MTTDTVEPVVAADFKAGVRGTDRPPGRGDLGDGYGLHLAPATLGFVVFYICPLRGAYLSFTEYSLLGAGVQRAGQLTNGPGQLFWNALVVTVEYVVINIGVQTVLAVGSRC